MALLPERTPVIVALNKIDAVKDKRALLPRIGDIAALRDFAALVPISAGRGSDLPALMRAIALHLPEGPALYDDDEVTDRDERFLVIGWHTVDGYLAWAAFQDLPQNAPKDIVNGYKWELYKLDDDPTQYEDVSAKYPQKVEEMKKLFMAEAAKYNVLPLDNRSLSRFVEPRPSASGGRTVFTYTGELANTPKGGAPSFLDRSYTITAAVEIPQGGAEGMLATDGGRFGGIGFYLLKGKPVFVYNYLNLERFRWEGKEALPPGTHTVVFDFDYDGIGFGLGGKGTLKVDGKVVDAKRIPKTLKFMFPEDETFDVGVDTRTPIDDRDYQVPFRFTGKLVKLTVEEGPIKGTLAQILEFKWKTRD